ncbi:class I lanthipeptide [Taibaiella helva]|uniref:class I lanthipeptide n=1 Tax=Taibaiella helva TaxID=2301235 RepID=UPI000E581358|nr:class I lanthipeptide [Taibaiella helva]
MKKKITLGKKLLLNKDMIAALDQSRQKVIQGGATATDPGCVGSNHCTNIACGPVTKDCATEKC